MATALSTSDGEQHSYSSLFHPAASKLSTAVTGQCLITSFLEPKKYTGSFIYNYMDFKLLIFWFLVCDVSHAQDVQVLFFVL